MGSSNIRDLLTTFSPSLDFFAISSGDGRIKIWDTLKGQVQTEFADIISTGKTTLYSKPERGHLSVDYTCLKWLSLDSKKKRKVRCSLLVLGTGSGDVLALDVSAGELKWRIGDCHPGGVSSISSSTDGLYIYASGADGMISRIDSSTGNLLGKFRASTKAISSMSVSSDGKVLATAAAQLKIFNSSDYKKIQKFSGHPGAVRCMIFTGDGKYVLSSAIGERYVAVWRLDGGKKQSASCVLAMEHPAVFLDSRCIDNGDVDKSGIYVLAISEIGVCYFWYAKNVEDLQNTKPTKVSVSLEDNFSKNHKGSLPTIFAARLQGVVKPASSDVFVAYGSVVKPSFKKVILHSGTDIKINISQDGILLPMDHSHKPKKAVGLKDAVTALDRTNAEEALLPIPKILDFHDKNGRDQCSDIDPKEKMADDLMNIRSQSKAGGSKDELEAVEASKATSCLEEELRSLGLLDNRDDLISNSILNSMKFKGIDLEANVPLKKIRAAVSSMIPSDAYELLKVLVTKWKSRSCSANYVLPWIYTIIVNHNQHILSQEPMTQLLDSLFKSTKSRGAAVQSLLQLSGGLQLVMAQIDKASQNRSQIQEGNQKDETEDEDDEVDDVLYGEEDDESQISSDNDD